MSKEKMARRSWTQEEKAAIVAKIGVDGTSIPAVARALPSCLILGS
ncbi:hypothetical protein [Flexibacterium corallicola]|nr:hypothetical protein [Pseudovibrio sp. M1P-2-3]